MLITVKFGNNDKITATTEINGEKIRYTGSRNYAYGASMNADIIAEKLMNKTKNFSIIDVEFVRESTNDSYIYISITQMTDRAVLTSNW